MTAEPCLCCGRPTGANPPRVTNGPIHMDCYLEHHCGPDVPWPPDHRCGVDADDDEPAQDVLDFGGVA